MKIYYKQWNRKEDVPVIILNWAEYIGGNSITIDEINELLAEYHKYISKLDDNEQLSATTDQPI